MRTFDKIGLCFLAAIFSAGCIQDVELTDDNDKPLVGEFDMVISAAQDSEDPETRTEVENWSNVYWLPADKLSVFSSGQMAEFVSQNSERAASTTFEGKIFVDSEALHSGDWIYAIYPYDKDATINDGVITTSLPAAQEAVAEGVADDLLATASRSRDPFVYSGDISFSTASSGVETSLLITDDEGNLYSGELNGNTSQSSGGSNPPTLALKMKFSHLCSGLRFSLTQKGIERITLTANGGQPLAGDFSFSWDELGVPVIGTVSNPSSSITLTAPGGGTFKKGVWYCFVTLPVQLPQGLTFTLEAGEKTGQRVISSAVNLKRGAFSRATDMDKNVELVEPIPDLPVISSNLPVLYVYTPNNTPITSKEVWVEESHAYLKDTDGTVTSLGKTSIRGRGNSTWSYKKKPYALKLDKKAKILDMSTDKRWDLLANFLDRTRLRNDIALEMGRRLTGLAWTPKGKYVELVLNGVHQGNYYLVEHIKISTERVNITEMKAKDTSEEAITGGYLLELGVEYDAAETNKFLSNQFKDLYSPNTWGIMHTGAYSTQLPFMIKDPDDDVIVPAQLEWITNYINDVQDKIVTGQGSEWHPLVDMDSFIDWMFIQEIVGNGEPLHPKSVYMYKNRGGKLCMGPLWDFDYNTFNNRINVGTIYRYSIWYGFMWDSEFFARAKQRWPAAKAVFQGISSYITAQAANNKASVARDLQIWGGSGKDINGDEGYDYDYAVSQIKNSITTRIASLDAVFGN